MSKEEETSEQQEQADFIATVTDEKPERLEEVKEVIAVEDTKKEAVIDKEVIKEAEDPFEKFNKRLRNVEGNIGGLKSTLQSFREEFTTATAKAVAKGEAAPTENEVKEALGSAESWDVFSKEYPHFAKPFEEQMALREKKIFSKYEADINPLQNEIKSIKESIKKDLDLTKETILVEIRYPDIDTTLNSDQFKDWLNAQDPEFQALMFSDKSKDALKLMDKYYEDEKAAQAAKSSTTASSRQKNNRLEESVTATRGGTMSIRSPAKSEYEDFIEAATT